MIKKSFILFFVMTFPLIIYGQQRKVTQAEEEITLFCDRNLYITGEKILFSAFIPMGKNQSPVDSSRVLYCELITPDGGKIAGNKHLIVNNSSCGSISIPKDLVSGIYYLRTYTKFMRNAGPYSYHYSRIKIVNPNLDEVQALNGNKIADTIFHLLNSHGSDESFLIKTDRFYYSQRDTVHLSIIMTENGGSLLKHVCIAVVPEFSASEQEVNISEIGQFENQEYYYPENRGLSVTGKISDKMNGKPLSKIRINLSIIGKGKDFMATQTDADGRFFFSLPDYKGNRDIFLCTEKLVSIEPKILVDNDFCTIPVRINSSSFTLTSKERRTAYRMAANIQLESYFRKDSTYLNKEAKKEREVFYGIPDEILYLDDFVELPTIEEYFNELPGSVKVRKRQSEKYFKVIGTIAEVSDIEPLVMVDLVAIDEPSKILAISPASISRIEIVKSLYIKGDMLYGGIINFISKKEDFAGIDLPSSGVFINYRFLEEKIDFKIPVLPVNEPDTRNTLYWDPQLVVDGTLTRRISFTTSDTPGKFIVILKAVDSDGHVKSAIADFEVKR